MSTAGKWQQVLFNKGKYGIISNKEDEKKPVTMRKAGLFRSLQNSLQRPQNGPK